MNEDKRIVEINGVKIEVDLRTAKRIDTFQVGDNVKVLKKRREMEWDVRPGIIVDFTNFKELPTIVVAVFNEGGWSGRPNIEFIHINAASDAAVEIVLTSEDEIRVSKDGIIEKFEREIQSKKNEWTDLQNQLDYFKKHFIKSVD